MGWADGGRQKRGPMKPNEQILYNLAYDLWGPEHRAKFIAIRKDLQLNAGLKGDDLWTGALAQYPPPAECLLAAKQAIARKKNALKQVIDPATVPLQRLPEKPAKNVTGIEWIDWVFANWSAAQPDPPAPGWLDLLEYYRANVAEFRKLWTREWRYDRVQKDKAALRAELRREKWQEIRKRKRQAEKAKVALAAEPHEEQDAELNKTLDTWSKPA